MPIIPGTLAAEVAKSVVEGQHGQQKESPSQKYKINKFKK
jgi:hypothetical protein